MAYKWPTNMYAMNEVNCIALECKCGKLHLLEDNVILESIKDGKPVFNEEGDFYVTSLTNYAMPFIRYETGDRGIISDEPCACGYGGYTISISQGRISEYVVLDGDESVNSYVLHTIITYTNEHMNHAIKQYQFEQVDIGKFKVTLALKQGYEGWKRAIEKEFVKNIREDRLKDAHWEFIYVSDIFPDSSGKVKSFISNIR